MERICKVYMVLSSASSEKTNFVRKVSNRFLSSAADRISFRSNFFSKDDDVTDGSSHSQREPSECQWLNAYASPDFL